MPREESPVLSPSCTSPSSPGGGGDRKLLEQAIDRIQSLERQLLLAQGSNGGSAPIPNSVPPTPAGTPAPSEPGDGAKSPAGEGLESKEQSDVIVTPDGERVSRLSGLRMFEVLYHRDPKYISSQPLYVIYVPRTRRRRHMQMHVYMSSPFNSGFGTRCATDETPPIGGGQAERKDLCRPNCQGRLQLRPAP